jgi:hypothetical protein
MVGVTVKVGEGTVGVNVETIVGVFVKNVGTTVTVGCIPNKLLTVIEQAESNTAKIRSMEIFFMWKLIPFICGNYLIVFASRRPCSLAGGGRA